MDKSPETPQYELISWDNFDRLLDPQELAQIKERLGHIHMNRDSRREDPEHLQLLEIAKALQRELEVRDSN